MTPEYKQMLRDKLEAWFEEQDELLEEADDEFENDEDADEDVEADDSANEADDSDDEKEVVEQPIPDLYTFYESLVALKTEVRAGNRKVADAFNAFSKKIELLEESVNIPRQQTVVTSTPRHDTLELQTSQLNHLIEVGESLERLTLAAGKPFAEVTFWQQINGSALTTANKRLDTLFEGAKIIHEKTEMFLTSLGLEKIQAKDQAFDPDTMIAVDFIEESGDFAPRVAEVIKNGFRRKGSLIRHAHVKVIRAKK